MAREDGCKTSVACVGFCNFHILVFVGVLFGGLGSCPLFVKKAKTAEDMPGVHAAPSCFVDGLFFSAVAHEGVCDCHL